MCLGPGGHNAPRDARPEWCGAIYLQSYDGFRTPAYRSFSNQLQVHILRLFNLNRKGEEHALPSTEECVALSLFRSCALVAPGKLRRDLTGRLTSSGTVYPGRQVQVF